MNEISNAVHFDFVPPTNITVQIAMTPASKLDSKGSAECFAETTDATGVMASKVVGSVAESTLGGFGGFASAITKAASAIGDFSNWSDITTKLGSTHQLAYIQFCTLPAGELMGIKFFAGTHDKATNSWNNTLALAGAGTLGYLKPANLTTAYICYRDFLNPDWTIESVTVYANPIIVIAMELKTSAGVRQYGNPRNATESQKTWVDYNGDGKTRLMGIWGSQFPGVWINALGFETMDVTCATKKIGEKTIKQGSGSFSLKGFFTVKVIAIIIAVAIAIILIPICCCVWSCCIKPWCKKKMDNAAKVAVTGVANAANAVERQADNTMNQLDRSNISISYGQSGQPGQPVV